MKLLFTKQLRILVVEYSGPGFITHTEERLIEEHYRTVYVNSEQNGDVANSVEIAAAFCSHADAMVPFPSAAENGSSEVSDSVISYPCYPF